MNIEKKYACIVIDPPWQQKKTGKRKCRPNQTQHLDYPTMTYEEIANIPIKQWSKPNSFIWLWVTNSKDYKTKTPIIKIGFDLLTAWEYTYFTIITWDKKTGPCPFAPYQITTEHILFGYKGKIKFNKQSLGKMKTCFEGKKGIHSEKPQELYDTIAKHFPPPRLNVFARKKRTGFDGWGNEYTEETDEPTLI